MDPERRPNAPRPNPSPGATGTSGVVSQRMYLHEPGWSVSLKVGSERVFCYQMAPGQDYYHRLLDGEIYVHHNDERLCLACAHRRGLITYEPRGLGAALIPLDLAIEPEESGGATP